MLDTNEVRTKLTKLLKETLDKAEAGATRFFSLARQWLTKLDAPAQGTSVEASRIEAA